MRVLSALTLVTIGYILLDFSIDFRPPGVHSSYQFSIGVIVEDQPQWLQQDNLTILLIKRSNATIQALRDEKGLQDPASNNSIQPELARNALRSSTPAYFVSYANGSDLGCIVELKSEALLGEVCGEAKYDFAGRAITGKNRFQNLAIPDYNFSDNFRTLIIRP